MKKKDFNYFALSVLPVIAVVLLSHIFSSLLSDWEVKTLDYRFQLRGNINTHPKIILIDCDDPSMARLGQWPWKRDIHAQFNSTLHPELRISVT